MVCGVLGVAVSVSGVAATWFRPHDVGSSWSFADLAVWESRAALQCCRSLSFSFSLSLSLFLFLSLSLSPSLSLYLALSVLKP